ncbi:CBO0543 family protein [Ferdinandcohnia sp. Marseille-Q9671]
MNTVKHLKNSNSQQLPKKQSQFWIDSSYLVTILVGTVIGTYLDLYFVGKGVYSFPMRPLSDIFTIHIGFTLLGLPMMLCVFLYICQRLRLWQKISVILLLSSIMSVGERLSEEFGLFVHVESWKHIYSFLGYGVYLSLMLMLHTVLKTKKT